MNQPLTHQDMKNGISDSSPKKRASRRKKVVDVKEPKVIENVTTPVEPLKVFNANDVDLYTPAQTITQFMNQIAVAKLHGVNTIEATREVMTQVIKNGYDPGTGYFIYNNIWVYEVGRREDIVKNEKISMEQKMFGKSKVVIDSSASIQEKTK
jgi:hypothetical protein